LAQVAQVEQHRPLTLRQGKQAFLVHKHPLVNTPLLLRVRLVLVVPAEGVPAHGVSGIKLTDPVKKRGVLTVPP
jgi:hypothetical protein